jgi:hypothetical protein
MTSRLSTMMARMMSVARTGEGGSTRPGSACQPSSRELSPRPRSAGWLVRRRSSSARVVA